MKSGTQQSLESTRNRKRENSTWSPIFSPRLDVSAHGVTQKSLKTCNLFICVCACVRVSGGGCAKCSCEVEGHLVGAGSLYHVGSKH